MIARRGAELYRAAIKRYEDLKKKTPIDICPVFIIGSEVPIPGGAQEALDGIANFVSDYEYAVSS